MALDKEQVRKIASLARIRMDENELETYASKLSDIIGFVEQLAEVNTDDVEPLPSPVDIRLHLREDKITDGGYPEKVLKNGPETLEGFFVVPKIVE